MAYLTLSGRISSDPYFDPRSLRRGYADWHEINVDIEDCEPINGGALTVSYRAVVRYSDAGDRSIVRVSLLQHQTQIDIRRGREPLVMELNPYDPAENGLLNLLMAHANSKAAHQDIEDAIQRHQADRDEEVA